ncbi:hypothetical protein D3C73_1103050 [compost metagenome]
MQVLAQGALLGFQSADLNTQVARLGQFGLQRAEFSVVELWVERAQALRRAPGTAATERVADTAGGKAQR